MSARIAIVTAYHLCRNPRVLKEATLLGHAGYEVTVFSVSAHPEFEALDQRLLVGAPFRRLNLDYLSLQPAARAAAFLGRLETWLARKLNRHLRLNLASALGPGTALRRQVERYQPDLTIVHTEAAAWAGTQLLRRGWRVAADFEDWYSEDLLPGARRHLPLGNLREIEGELLRRAAFVTTTSAALAAALHHRYGGTPPVVIANCFPLDPSPPPRPADRPPRLVWFSQTVGPGRGLEEFFAAWSLHPDPPPVTLVGGTSAGYGESLLSRLPRPLGPRVSFHPWVAPPELPALLADFDVGLALEPRVPRNKDLTISNKILQYLNAGLAVLASETTGQREVLARQPEAGVVVALADAPATARALEGLIGDRPALQRRQAAARQLAEDVYCWEKVGPRLLATVADALRDLPGGPPAAGRRPLKRLGRRALQGLVRRALRARQQPYDFGPTRNALVVAPHEDDASLGCGGLIARKRALGQSVRILFLTNGDASHRGHPTLTPLRLAELRHREAVVAMAQLGVAPSELTFLDLPDGTLDRLGAARVDTVVGQISEILVRMRPDEIFLPCHRDGSSEHEAAFALVQSALRRVAPQPRIMEYPVWALWNPLRLFRPLLSDVRVWRADARAHARQKQQAVASHSTQVDPTPPWGGPVLSADFVRLFSSGEEFFFESSPATFRSEPSSHGN